MGWHVWLAFVAASAVMGLAPGPGVMSLVPYALSSGRTTALASVAGLAMGLWVSTLSLVVVRCSQRPRSRLPYSNGSERCT